MGVIKNFFTKAKAMRQAFVSTITTRYQGGLLGMGNKNGLEEYKNWPYACITARAEEIGNTQLILKKGDKVIDKHDVLTLLQKVNPQMTKHALFAGTQSFKDLDGNAYWYLARDNDGKGKIKEIYLLRPDRMTIVLDDTNPLLVKGYIYKQDATHQIPFGPKEILHHKNFNPLGNWPFPHKGLGVIQAASWAIDTDNEARQWNYKFFKNSAKPDGILYQEGEGVASAEEHKRLEEEWHEKFQGSENAHKIVVLSGGLKWEEVTRSQIDMDFVNQRTFSRDEILSLFRTPKSIIGITDDVNRANAEASIYVFALRTVKPLMQQLVDTLNEFLLPEFGDDLELSFVSPVPADRLAQIQEYSLGIDKWLSRNEIRAMEALPPTENGDIFNAQGIFTEVDKVKPQPTKSAKPETKDDKPAEKKGVAENIVDKFTAKMPSTRVIKTIGDEAKAKYMELWLKTIEINTSSLKKKLIKYFEAQKTEVMKNLQSEMKGLDAKEYKLKGLNDVLFDEEESISAGISLITPYLKEYLKAAGIEAAKLVDAKFDDSTKNTAAFIKDRSKYFAETINTTTADSLMSTLKEGTDAGESIDDLAARVSAVYTDAENYRTEMIARTEVSAASNFGSIEAYDQAGIEEIQWVVASPQDADCLENDGAVVKIGDAFPSGDDQPPVHPNCVCATVPVF